MGRNKKFAVRQRNEGPDEPGLGAGREPAHNEDSIGVPEDSHGFDPGSQRFVAEISFDRLPVGAADVARTGFVIFTALTVLVDLYSNDGLSLC